MLHFQQASGGCHCCWSMDHPLNNKDLEKQGKVFRNRSYNLPFFCELATYFLTCGLYFSHHLFSAYSVKYAMPGSRWKLRRERKREREKELKLLKLCGKKHYFCNQFFRVECEKSHDRDEEHRGCFSNIAGEGKVILQPNPLSIK